MTIYYMFLTLKILLKVCDDKLENGHHKDKGDRRILLRVILGKCIVRTEVDGSG
jgi:hypothetical protein